MRRCCADPDLAKKTGAKNLCLAGGVALNCVANGKVLRDGAFKNIWIQPAAGDAGGAVGAALAAVHIFKGEPRKANGRRRHGRRATWSELPPVRHRAQAHGAGARFEVLDEDKMIETDSKGTRWSTSGRLVPGPYGVRPAFARRALDPGRSALTDHAAQPQSEGQISREFPAIRAVGAARGRLRLVRTRFRQPLHADRCRRAGRTGAAP